MILGGLSIWVYSWTLFAQILQGTQNSLLAVAYAEALRSRIQDNMIEQELRLMGSQQQTWDLTKMALTACTEESMACELFCEC